MISLRKHFDFIRSCTFNHARILTKCLNRSRVSVNSLGHVPAADRCSKNVDAFRPLCTTIHASNLGLLQPRPIRLQCSTNYLLNRSYHVRVWNFRNDSNNEVPFNAWRIKTERRTCIPKHVVSCHSSQTSLLGNGDDRLRRRRLGKQIRRTRQQIMKTKDIMKEKMEEIIQRENVVTIPNILCLTRIALTPVLGGLVLNHCYEPALGIFVIAGITDLLDGMIARNFPSQQSMLGSFLDPMADKFLVCLVFLSLTVAELIPIPLTMLIVTRDLCLVSAGFYVRYLSLPPPRTFGRYFDVTHATAKISPTLVSKINTSVQLTLVACTLAAPVFHMVDHPALHLLWYITAWTTISSGLSYLFSDDTFQLLKKNKKELDKVVAFTSVSKTEEEKP